MDPVAVVGGADLCVRAGAVLLAACRTCETADELRARVEGLDLLWSRTRSQLQFVQRVFHLLDSNALRILDGLLAVLAAKLSVAQNRAVSVTQNAEARTASLSFGNKGRRKHTLAREMLDETFRDLGAWRRHFDPVWFLIMRISNPEVDKVLNDLLDRDDDLKQRGQSPITLAVGLRLALNPNPSHVPAARRDSQWYIVERYMRRANSAVVALQDNDVRELARKLRHVDPWTFGFLGCRGVIRVVSPERDLPAYDFVFRMPDGLEVLHSLRQSLLASSRCPLLRRVECAREFAKSVGYLHNFGFVHKNIRPESILVSEGQSGSRFSTFLIGFDCFRSEVAGTLLVRDSSWERDIYRQGAMPSYSYRLQHDIYSLGVCLLEIGLWESFVSYSLDPEPVPQMDKFYSNVKVWIEGNNEFKAPPKAEGAYRALAATRLKGYFVHLAETELLLTMGGKYKAVVLSCLTCVDEEDDDDDFGREREMNYDYGIPIGLRFVEQVLAKLNDISV